MRIVDQRLVGVDPEAGSTFISHRRISALDPAPARRHAALTVIHESLPIVAGSIARGVFFGLPFKFAQTGS